VKRVDAELQSKALTKRLAKTQDEAMAQYSIAESAFGLKRKFCRAKEQVRKYKKKAQSFYKQLTFASWGWDSGWGAGYIGGFETF
jgi:hypothetical protein